ncbi:MAG: S8 family serine peptidase [Firmicutes bacterium]|nr:S8 family serine peptidase [Bacillota bacterium]
MQFLKRVLLRNPFLILLAFLMAFPHAVSAESTDPAPENSKIVIVKDSKSGAVIYQTAKSFYYGFTAPTSSSIIEQGEIDPTEIIVKYKNGKITTEKLNSVTKAIGNTRAKVSTLNEKLGFALVKLSDQQEYFTALSQLAKNSNVEYAEPNYVAHITQTPNDPYYTQQWGPQDIHADLAWDKVNPAQRGNVTIAVLDTGINASHEDLQASIVPGYNFINNDNNPVDGHGHGTHVAGIAAAITNNGKGIAGVAGGAKIMPVKVMNDYGSGDYASIINGIKYAADNGAQVISMSLGGPGSSQAMQDAVNYAIGRGASVVAASGNSNSAVAFPGNCNGVITVGAVSSNNQRASFSNYGPEMDVVAPGVNIISSYKGNANSYTSMSGTSMATPFVAGVTALVRAANPSLAPAEVTQVIDQATTDLGTAGFDNYYGYGLVDANKAVDLALKGQTGNPAPAPAPAPNPAPVPTPSPSLNLALNKTAVASSVEGSARTAVKVVDGNAGTRWASQPGVDPQWIYVDLGKTHQISQVVLKWETAFARAFQVYVSSDGNNWTNIYSTSYGNGGTNTINTAAQGRYVMVYGNRRATAYGYSLWELEVYGK